MAVCRVSTVFRCMLYHVHSSVSLYTLFVVRKCMYFSLYKASSFCYDLVLDYVQKTFVMGYWV